ncbi:MAG: hypothetical protein L0H84_12970 [Pseudonocardia sp.]|nr:hypothetical protein [Pseudonocardia sp.]
MTLRVAFSGGPADGVVHDYTGLCIPLPSLYWRGGPDDAPGHVYRRAGSAEDPSTGAWLYEAVSDRRPGPTLTRNH